MINLKKSLKLRAFFGNYPFLGKEEKGLLQIR